MTGYTETENFNQILAQFGNAIDAQIQEELRLQPQKIGPAADFMQGAISYHFGWSDQQFKSTPGGNSGKKLRPVMALLAYQGAHPLGAKADLTPMLPLAAAIEMIHNYSLIHDDIEDDDQERRGRPTAWTIWGKPRAINIGDCLHVLAFSRLYRATEAGLPIFKTLQAARQLTLTSVQLAHGQHQDITFEKDGEVTPEAYLDMISGKTAALIRCAVWLGGMAALDSDEPDRLKAFADFGEQIGIGFQMRDDILGIWGIAKETGKPVANDIRRRKKSLPIIYAMNNSKGEDQKRLLELYKDDQTMSEYDVSFVLDQMEKSEARQFVQKQADLYKSKAIASLEEAAGGAIKLSQNRPLMQLKQLSTFLVERSF